MSNAHPIPRIFPPLEDRFWAKVEPEPTSGCYLWTGAWSKDHYGFFHIDGRMERAHRAAWILAGREIPPGLYLLHRCDVRACVRLDHLFLGTNQDNMDDRSAKGKYPLGREHHNGRKTQCRYGHPFDERNTHITSNGGRHCLACRVMRNRFR